MSLLTPEAQVSPQSAPDGATGESPVLVWLRERTPAWAGKVLLPIAGLLVFWPAIRCDFAIDDFIHAAMVRGTYPVPRAAYDLYNLVDDSSRTALLERGLLPWWTHPELQISFFRPLASLLRWADYSVLGDSALAHHVHSFLWWLVVVFGARALFRSLLPSRPASIATVVFALAPCHAIPLVWLANREALVSLAFGLPGLLFYVRWREHGAARDAVLAAIAFAVALAGGEYALAFTGYVAAFELLRGREAIARRLVGPLPFVVPATAYFTLRTRLGHGAIGSGFYADPLHDPQQFFRYAPARFVSLLVDAWFGLDRETFGASLWSWLFGTVAVGGLVVVGIAIRATYRDLDDPTRRRVRWLLVGSTLSLIPMLAVVSSSRLVGVCVIGVAAMVGLVLDRAWFAVAVRPTLRGVAGIAAVILGFIHLVHGPASAWLTGNAYHTSTTVEAIRRAELRARLPSLDDTNLVVVRGGPSAPFHLPFAVDRADHQLPARYAVLSQTGHVLAVRRGPRTLELIASQNESLIPLGEYNIYLDMRRVFAVDEVIRLPFARATIRALTAGRPRIVEFEFDEELDSASLRLMTETNIGFIEVQPPGEGMGMPFDP